MPGPAKKPYDQEPEEPAQIEASKHTLTDQHKISVYVEMGFSWEQAEHLVAIPGVYAANVREKYIRKGCTPELAYSILRSE